MRLIKFDGAERGKKQIPVFGDTETAKEGFKKDVVALLNVAKSDSAAQKTQKSKTKKGDDCEDETQDWLFGRQGPRLKENRVSEAQNGARPRQGSKRGLSTLNGGFLASDGAGGDGTSLQGGLRRGGRVGELSQHFQGEKRVCCSKRAQAEQGITRTTKARMAQAALKRRRTRRTERRNQRPTRT